MNITFVLDSASDYCVEQSTCSVPLTVIPLNIAFGNDHYLDNVTITTNEFYERMAEEKELPKTSQPSPQAFYELFTSQVEKGNEVIYFGLATNLSGTVQSATIGRSMLSDQDQQQVFIVDSGTASAGIQVLVRQAERLAFEGMRAEQIVEKLAETKKSIIAYVLLETIENVKKGGRISAVQGAIAEILNIKPLLAVQDGIVETVGKFRGKKKGLTRLKELFQEWKDDHPGKELFIIHSLPSKSEVMKEFGELFSLDAFKNVSFTRFGSTIGTYASENAIGFIFH
ncbi:degV family protein [Fictibacillus macauensis ZFHKF-1]|uniref:DegV family protein n=1 Tax=Fictibacillus macauensis ZFHKF-1 TaxID=1196324 RepID=I8UCT0_9BACL|nr:DegV family protein [Fictibacillus macauensis]EIT84593.1 degV family protein [Fictibacillus macauensis ZFHKF-1]